MSDQFYFDQSVTTKVVDYNLSCQLIGTEVYSKYHHHALVL